ncbi:MAG TPA: sugar phosphate isomerase/epimerase [Bryobacteraceae bacterium]|nr:sugar phosphate isomerase/epimerase [Bryobacteraceae bacterium]
MRRRTFLQAASTAAVAAMSSSAEPLPIKLGFDSYSIRAFEWKAIELLDYAARLKLDTVQLSSLGDYESLEPGYLQRVKDHAARVGVTIDAGIGCICPSSPAYNKKEGEPEEYVTRGLRVAQAVGSRVMRCYMGTRDNRRTKLPLEAHIENTVKVLHAVRSRTLDAGIRIAVENHAGDMQARELKGLIEAAGKDFVGATLDTGNPMWVAEDPFLTLETLAPYVATSHIRDSAVFEHPRGAAAQWVALGDGSVDFVRFASLFHKLCPAASMQLEIITGRPPEVLPYLEPDYWTAFRKTPAWEFARFVALAKSGRPFLGNMVIGEWSNNSPTIEAALREQQRVDLERSLEYAKKKLGVGVRWRS